MKKIYQILGALLYIGGFLALHYYFVLPELFPGGTLFNYFDTGEIGYVFVGPIFLYVPIYIVCIFVITKIDKILHTEFIKNCGTLMDKFDKIVTG